MNSSSFFIDEKKLRDTKNLDNLSRLKVFYTSKDFLSVISTSELSEKNFILITSEELAFHLFFFFNNVFKFL